MGTVRTKYRNKKFAKERIELDGHAYEHCDFVDCLIVLENGDTELQGCTFKNCRLLLLGQALRIAKIIQVFIGGKPLKVLDFAEPGIFGGKEKMISPRVKMDCRRGRGTDGRALPGFQGLGCSAVKGLWVN